MSLSDDIETFLKQNPGEHHADAIANAVGIVSTTASRHLLDMFEAGTVDRRLGPRTGLGGRRRYLYRINDTAHRS